MELLEIREKENDGDIIRINTAKLKNKLIKLGVIFVLIAILVGAIFVLKAQNDRLHDEIADLLERLDNPAIAESISPQIVLDVMKSEIKGIGELATVEYLFTDAAKFTDSKQIKEWNIPFTEKSFIMKWNGVIKAGVLVNEIDIEVDESRKKVIIYIPAAEILSYSVDTENVEILDEKNNIFNRITVDDKVKFDAKTEEAMKERAIENGLLDKAQANAEDIILKLFRANTAISDQYSIECRTK